MGYMQRRHELDLLRALMVLGLVFFHTARVFDILPFSIKNGQQSIGMTAFVLFCSLWGMPLLFLIAGFSSRFSLGRRSWSGYLRERTQRLLLPLLFGLLVVVPPQGYCTYLARTGAHLSYWEFYPRFFAVRFEPAFPGFLEAREPVGGFELAHLWFLYYLFLFSVLLLPLFLLLQQQERGRRMVAQLTGAAERPGLLFLPGLWLALIEATLGTQMEGGWNLCVYLLVFLYGYLLALDARLEQALERRGGRALVLALLSSLTVLGGYTLCLRTNIDPASSHAWPALLLRFIKGWSCWFWLVAILGLGRKLSRALGPALASAGGPQEASPPRPSSRAAALILRVIRYTSPAILPIYVLHQTVIVVIAFHVVRWEAGVPAKFLVTSVSSLVITLLLYELAVRHLPPMRFLFGMKPRSARS